MEFFLNRRESKGNRKGKRREHMELGKKTTFIEKVVRKLREKSREIQNDAARTVVSKIAWFSFFSIGPLNFRYFPLENCNFD